MTAQRALAVLGSPIGHSKSPALHSAAYRVLGLPWRYEAIEVTGETLPSFLDGLDPEWRGLSLTMPLKRDILPLLETHDRVVDLAGGANTVLFDWADGERHLHGFNTDVHGIVAAFTDAGVDSLNSLLILGGGATAASMLVAASHLGAGVATVGLRDQTRGTGLLDLGAKLGLEVRLRDLGASVEGAETVDAVVSTLPGGAADALRFAETVRAGSLLFDVAYAPWPSVLANTWADAGGRIVSGLEMLLHQAVIQIRIFVSGDPGVVLPEEDRVIAAMRAAIA